MTCLFFFFFFFSLLVRLVVPSISIQNFHLSLYVLICMCLFLQALMSLFVLASKDGWVNIMYHGLDAVAVDQQVMFPCNMFADVPILPS